MAGRALGALVEGVLLALMVVLCVDVFLGVFSRYVMGKTFTWYDEIARLCFVWIVFLGMAVGVRRAAHFRLHLVVDRFPQRLQQAMAVLLPSVIVTFADVLVHQGLVFLELGRFQQTPVMGLPKIWIYVAIPIGGALMILYTLVPLWQAFRGLFR